MICNLSEYVFILKYEGSSESFRPQQHDVPCLILGHNFLNKIGWIRMKARQKIFWNIKHVQALVWCQHSGYLSGIQFSHPKDFCKSCMNRPDTDARSLCYVFDSHTPIIHHHTINSFHLCISSSWLWAPCPCVL